MVEQKAQIWERMWVTVEAESLEEAIKKCSNCEYYSIDESEVLYDTIEYMAPTEDNPVTEEIFDTKGTLLFSNNIRNG